MARVLKSPAAIGDLTDIWLYIARDNLRAADDVLDKIEDRSLILAKYPRMGQRRPELGSDIHSFAIGRYIVFYRPAAGGIEVIRVLHGARDIGSTF